MTQQPISEADDQAAEDRTSTQTGQATDRSQAEGGPSAIKDPDDWTTGDERPTAAQLSYLGTLATEAGVEVPDGLTKAEASKLIDDLQERTGRGA
jgi:hypothetical protein